MKKDDIDIVRGYLDAVRPVPLTTVSVWADKNRRLTSESAAEPGPWVTDRTPYLREIMDALSPSNSITEVRVAKGVQLGFTESGLNAVGCYIDLDPCPIMYVMPTLEMAKAISESRIDPMVNESPALRKKVRPNREKDSGNTKFVKRFAGGILILSGANSAASLRSRPVRMLVLDEVDAYPISVDNEGSPISLAEKRTSTYGDRRKIYKLSTPTIEGQSVIQKEYEATEQRKFYVPCVHCGHMDHLRFENLKWDKGSPETAAYYCTECGAAMYDRHKTQMLAAGEWRATVPGNQKNGIRGYHINSLYSPSGWLSWTQVAEAYEKAEKDEEEMKVFVNTILGETYKEKGDAPEWQNIYNRRETYQPNTLHNDVVFLTAGADVQRDRIEVEIVGWCSGKRNYSIDYRVLTGDTSKPEVWRDLDNIVNEQWTRDDGALIPLKLMALDSGYNTQAVYDYCARWPMRVVPVKGQDSLSQVFSPPRQVNVTKAGKKIGKTKVYHIGSSHIKSELYGWLRIEIGEDGVPPSRYCHFPQYDHHYFKMLTAEQVQYKIIRGFRVPQWVKKYDRNEALDCRVYARAAASIVGIDRMTDEQLKAMSMAYNRTNDVQAKPNKEKRERRSSFW